MMGGLVVRVVGVGVTVMGGLVVRVVGVSL